MTTKTREEMIARIREACIAANSELKDRDIHCPRCECMDARPVPQEIQLADVLLAMDAQHVFDKTVTWTGGSMAGFAYYRLLKIWNLRRTLEDQTDKTIGFIHSLLA